MIGSIVNVLVKLHLVHNPEATVEEVMQDAGYHFNSNTAEAKFVKTEIMESQETGNLFDPEDYIDFDSDNPYWDMDPDLELERAIGLIQALLDDPKQYPNLRADADSFLKRHLHLLHHRAKAGGDFSEFTDDQDRVVHLGFE